MYKDPQSRGQSSLTHDHESIRIFSMDFDMSCIIHKASSCSARTCSTYYKKKNYGVLPHNELVPDKTITNSNKNPEFNGTKIDGNLGENVLSVLVAPEKKCKILSSISLIGTKNQEKKKASEISRDKGNNNIKTENRNDVSRLAFDLRRRHTKRQESFSYVQKN